MDDLWVYTKLLDMESFPGAAFKKTYGKWTQKQPLVECYQSPGLSWESRFDETCVTIQPSGRAGHGSAYDTKRNIIWIFGGYSTYFPYLRTDGIGSGKKIKNKNRLLNFGYDDNFIVSFFAYICLLTVLFTFYRSWCNIWWFWWLHSISGLQVLQK